MKTSRLEKAGRYILSRNLFTLSLWIFALPVIGVCMHTAYHYQTLLKYKKRLCKAESTAYYTRERRSERRHFLEKYKNANEDFLEKALGGLILCQEERLFLQNAIHHPAFASKALSQRLAKLSGKENTLRFKEENITQSALVKETGAVLLNTVIMDKADLAKILSIIEQTEAVKELCPPQLMIKSFTFKPLPKGNFSINFELLKREFTKK